MTQFASAAPPARGTRDLHLDKLVDAGLRETTFRGLTGRTGPGAERHAAWPWSAGRTSSPTEGAIEASEAPMSGPVPIHPSPAGGASA